MDFNKSNERILRKISFTLQAVEWAKEWFIRVMDF